MPLNANDFEMIRTLVRQRSAIVLENGKETMVESRLTFLARREGIGSMADILGRLRKEPYGRLHEQVVEAMTTNETLFFRDILPFDALKSRILPELIKNRESERRLYVWCAGCSSGQEPYSVAMILKEYFPQVAGQWTLKILAGDISTEMIAKARAGRYTQFEVNRGLPALFLVKYFQQAGIEWHLREDIRRMVQFDVINLANPWPVLPPFDIVFLRNVLIYFDVETKKDILTRMRKVLKPDGYLILGAAETTLNLDDKYKRLQLDKAWCYQPHEE